ncbi:tetraacyldisaccharide 4'-kinase [Candidatus Pelagibacter sp.]|nr:tetraacyldisaccharide 4'-kinase [Candidatus Pelagibacter sp.]
MKIKKPSFWDNKELSVISILLLPFTLIIIISNLLKSLKRSNREFKNIKTICVGNIYIGGTGKTPLAVEINRIAKKSKLKTTFIKKFYSDSIDEQILLEKNGNCILAKNNRVDALKEAIINKFDLAIFDDGLQDKSINYDMKIVCFNNKNFIGNGFLIPSGPLRENISSLKKFDAVFLNGDSPSLKSNITEIKRNNKKIKIFETTYELIKHSNINKRNKFIAFAGIGVPENFKETLNNHKFNVVKFLSYPDHYDYSTKDIKKIKQIAKTYKAKILTTEKDYFRIKKNYNFKNEKNIKFLKMQLKIKNKNKFIKFLNSKI